jgi:hypothetical protein
MRRMQWDLALMPGRNGLDVVDGHGFNTGDEI